jgi:hypothetical protein
MVESVLHGRGRRTARYLLRNAIASLKKCRDCGRLWKTRPWFAVCTFTSMLGPRLFAVILALGTVVVGGTALAGTKLVSVGDVATTAPRAVTKLRVVRATLEREVDSIDWRAATKMKRYVVSVAVTNLKTERTEGGVATTCELSTTLRGATDGKIIAVMSHRARAEGDANHVASAEDGAIQVAATSAIREIPKALLQSRQR